MKKCPVFIVGSPRSGTSILVDAMVSVGYKGFREGNFLTLMTTINNMVDRHFKTFGEENPHVLVAQVDPENLKERIQDIFAALTNNLNPAPLWFDKTGNPDMITAIPTLRRLWPDSVFIFAKRRALENIVSRQKKFPKMSFEYHCADWAKNMSAWRAMRENIPSERFIEIDQQDLLQHPQDSARRIIGLLGLGEELETKLLNTFASNRPQQSDEGSATRVLDFAGVSWSEVQRDVFMKTCAQELEAFGYSLDSRYWTKS